MENNASNFGELFASMPVGQLILYLLFAAIWLIGFNILTAFHYKRKGKHWASGFKPFAFPFKDFNKGEWLISLLLVIFSLFFGYAALNYGA